MNSVRAHLRLIRYFQKKMWKTHRKTRIQTPLRKSSSAIQRGHFYRTIHHVWRKKRSMDPFLEYPCLRSWNGRNESRLQFSQALGLWVYHPHQLSDVAVCVCFQAAKQFQKIVVIQFLSKDNGVSYHVAETSPQARLARSLQTEDRQEQRNGPKCVTAPHPVGWLSCEGIAICVVNTKMDGQCSCKFMFIPQNNIAHSVLIHSFTSFVMMVCSSPCEMIGWLDSALRSRKSSR